MHAALQIFLTAVVVSGGVSERLTKEKCMGIKCHENLCFWAVYECLYQDILMSQYGQAKKNLLFQGGAKIVH